MLTLKLIQKVLFPAVIARGVVLLQRGENRTRASIVACRSMMELLAGY